MKKSLLAIALAGSVSLSACASNPNMVRNAGVGGLGGAAIGAVIPGISVAQGALAGAAIGGLSGALWTDQNNDGYVDGYTQNGQYYAGTPSGYDNGMGRVVTGAGIGAGVGAVAGAVIPGLSVLGGAVIGAAVGGLAGAVWTDSNNDGQVDGYSYQGRYYQGAPATTSTPAYSSPVRSGERG